VLLRRPLVRISVAGELVSCVQSANKFG
jgi:hypothetical protein